jgi:ABC-type transporter Mla subunit MlaD
MYYEPTNLSSAWELQGFGSHLDALLENLTELLDSAHSASPQLQTELAQFRAAMHRVEQAVTQESHALG